MNAKYLLLAAIGSSLAVTSTVVTADDMVNNYITSGSGSVVMDSSGNCWRTSYKDTSEKLEACGYEKPMAVMTGEVEVVATPTAASLTAMVMDRIEIAAEMLFAFDSADLSDDARAIIDERIQALRGQAKLTSKMQIEGHTDSIGTEAYNMDLSLRRAQAVADYIVNESYNVEATDIEITGKGESEPLAGNDTATGRAKNRRVTVYAEGEMGK